MKKCVKWTGLMVAVLCVVLFNGIPANAQAQNPCAEDVAKFCKDVKPGEGRVVRCLKDNSDRLSNECRDNLMAAKKKPR